MKTLSSCMVKGMKLIETDFPSKGCQKFLVYVVVS